LNRTPSPRRRISRRFLLTAGALIFVTVLALTFAFALRRATPGEDGTAGGYVFQVGSPGPGEAAPPLRLPTANGTIFDLAGQTGTTVLLYFQEGLMCQPCWDQLVDIEASWDRFNALGIDTIASVTTDSIELLPRKVADEGLASPVLSDPDRRVSEEWGTLDYGMMGGSFNGHSFIVVGPDGTILWRADYGGAPDYTMYLPVPALLADLEEGLNAGA
ncbi:MAG: redoxin domain-containing protein, partial [Acidimicrobiia bacterium]